MSVVPARAGKHAFIEQLVAAGARYVFGNPGTTEQAFVDALQDHDGIELVLCLHEGVAVGAAEGHARATGTPAVVELHTAPGLGNGLGMLLNAKVGHTPLVVYVGGVARSASHAEPVLSGDLVAIATPAAKWVWEVRTADEIPTVVRRAFKVAAAEPPGPVVIIVPTDVMDEPCAMPVLPVSYVRGRVRPDPEAVAEAVQLVNAAQSPVLLVGDGVARSAAQAEVAELADRIGASIHQAYASEVCVLPGEPLDAGVLPLFDAAVVTRTLAHADLVIAVGVDVLRQAFPPPGPPLGIERPVVHIGADPWELAKNQPSLAILGDERSALRDLIDLVDEAPRPRVAEVERRLAENRLPVPDAGHAAGSDGAGAAGPLLAEQAVAALAGALPDGAVIVDESVSAMAALGRAIRPAAGEWFRSRGGALGAGMAVGVGVQLASSSRPVVAVVGDGAAMYSVTALWTAAHHRIGTTFVILNNRSYKILKHNTRAYLNSIGVGPDRAFVGADLDDPAIDFVGLARALGVQAVRVETVQAIGEALREAVADPGPRLIEILLDRPT